MRGPSDDIKGSWGNELDGKKIIFCVTGSISAYRIPDVIRSLVRHGADVYPVMSEAARKIIHPYTLEWASGRRVLVEMTGKLEHLYPQFLEADLVVVAPATLNIIGKMASGVADEIVSTLLSAALGLKIPILVVPAMHEAMYENEIFKKNVEKLKKVGVHFLEPNIVEGKAKLPEVDDIVDAIIREVYRKDMEGLSVIVTAGPTLEYIDPIRVITNRSSGKMGLELARNAWYRGAKVVLLYGRGTVKPPRYIKTIRVETTEEMYEVVKVLLEKARVDVFIAAAAAADYKPESRMEGKIRTSEVNSFNLNFVLTPKIIDIVKKISPNTFLVAFKAEYGLGKEEMINYGYERLLKANGDMIVINDVSRREIGFESDENEVYVVDREKNVIHIPKDKKRVVAEKILDIVVDKLKRSKR